MNGTHRMFVVGFLPFHANVSRHKKRRWDPKVCKIRVSLCSGTSYAKSTVPKAQPQLRIWPTGGIGRGRAGATTWLELLKGIEGRIAKRDIESGS